MEISLSKAGLKEASIIHEMQIKAFMPLLNKYKDYETNPSNQTVEQIEDRINQSYTDYHLIREANIPVGAIRIVKKENKIYRVSPVFILPDYQGRGIAQKVFSMIEDRYSDARIWELATISEEQRNCYLYEKLGYRQKGDTKQINDKMTIVIYEKRMT
ncbi:MULTISPECIES: GNAT family N-acetyltransferase [unclassified Paenibacillus]|uniref:GNAT family N-acetyltransferase n=1 Tax=unclassified Paenibacillus TaxID=185978 RepID=UPI0009A66D2B|nr:MULTISPECIES: GNAT family N-acetyltransferase [unclassified Paenibacillus]SLJ96798.1 Acetyltransferase (GNAT) domain-containing protein [Paenibacillus sp. RU5A]SOC67056.1 Acetyltransferase (GNAT) domain-containing protein [Paenibacillus sp. RU26A]SOC69796.1 Acetyltransferase (GNAT) domain-containing protein [Paenibacillus sp. RU5M]